MYGLSVLTKLVLLLWQLTGCVHVSPCQLSRMRRHINLLQLQRYLGRHELPVQHKLELVAVCLHHYRGGLRLGGEFGENTSQPADFYMVLAAHLKMELYHETGEGCGQHLLVGVVSVCV